jgi:aspartyl-tRNA(Asn)/glutamyl-tRNA(Gln) amidotransferase subunit A
VPGGSSSGSGAALAAGLCVGALGSDTGGSIRSPASYCGISGLKPTYGLCSRHAVLPLSWTLDHTGPMARSAEDCALLLQAIAGHDPLDPASTQVEIPDYTAGLEGGISGLRVGAPLSYLESLSELSPETDAAYRAALTELERLGARVQAVELPRRQHFDVVGQTILVAEGYTYHEQNLQERPQLYGTPFRTRIRAGGLLSAADYINAQRGRAMIRREMHDLMQSIDLIAMPTSPSPAKTFAEESATPSSVRLSFTRPFNVTGQPAISIPCGFSEGGLPIGLQLAGRAFEDALVLRAAHAYQGVTDWHLRHPSL